MKSRRESGAVGKVGINVYRGSPIGRDQSSEKADHASRLPSQQLKGDAKEYAEASGTGNACIPPGTG